MTAHAAHHGSRRWMVPLIVTALVAAVGCTSASSPTPSTPAATPAAPSTPPSARPSSPASQRPASPTVQPSASAVPGIGLAPAGPWTSLRWLAVAEGIPLGPSEVSLHGWSGGFVALEQSSGSDENGNELPVVIRASSSTDGVHWTRPADLKTGFKGMFHIEQIVEGPSGLLALAFPYGDTCGGAEPVSAMWESRDGVTWERLPMPKAFQGAAVETIAGGDAGFIALGTRAAGQDRAIWTSPDGRTWTAAKLPTVSSGTLALDAAASFGDGFVLVGSVLGEEGCGGAAHVHPATWFSADGSSWTRTSLPGASTDKFATLQVRTVLGRLLVTQGVPGDDTQLRAWTSTDGRAWTPAGPVSADTSWGAVSDGRHVVMVVNRDDGAIASVVGLDNDGRNVNLALHGNGPVPASDTQAMTSAVGPTGVLVARIDGSEAWLGVPS